ncbi:hypothetical protein N9D85_02620 [Flavobacteriaceae bacterium]|nr:hypothetical protein [Flavobacteriaceae bacterium]
MLLWNEYDRGYLFSPNQNHYLSVEVEVTSPKFWVLPISSSQIEKYNYIKKKRDEGYYYYQISDMMNESHFKPQRTDIFTPQQVWGLEFKMEKRLKRLDKIENPKVVSIGLISEV